ncbi:winged helix-turn-helix transcriptional regulator [Mangrovibrevibacter kandeliae]|uniref:winged helix-turn-helix transcriptional regulator n=1 Tax=Mangrovibrevibacter kandeliae TaxID=2968473 RepID=UPI002119472C|nr:winged helix-turn-helix transcriptional regulator [Aurantimonas sp. CSK15Z-1]MCQ8783702.1 winged helix-turn-helix transcriptional regulator [Aurantimonas sp. CSK15Z-1]
MKSEKITRLSQASRRSYDDACAAAHALDLIGERWALLVMRELMLGPRRFSDLRAALPGISANVLTQRLEGLEANGVLRRRELPPPAASRVYELTAWGHEAEPILQTLGRWAARSPLHDPTRPFSTASLILSLRTMFDGSADRPLRIGLRTSTGTYLARVADGEIAVDSAPLEAADAVLAGTPEVIAAAIYGGVPLADLEAAGALTLAGDRVAVERFVRLFPLPPKAKTEALNPSAG